MPYTDCLSKTFEKSINILLLVLKTNTKCFNMMKFEKNSILLEHSIGGDVHYRNAHIGKLDFEHY